MHISLSKYLKLAIYLFLPLIIAGSLALAQQKNTKPKTIQLFAKEDDPSRRLSVEDDQIIRKRSVLLKPDLYTKNLWGVRNGDKLFGYLFDDEYMEATVKHYKLRRKSYLLSAEMDGSRGTASLMSNMKGLVLVVDLEDAGRAYRCLHDRDAKSYIMKELKSRQLAKEWAKAALDNEFFTESKTFKLFAENDDPKNRKPVDRTQINSPGRVRERYALVNPQFFSDRLDEINTGDIIAGYLFEDEYFEGIVTEHRRADLEMRSKGYRSIFNIASLSSSAKSFFLDITDRNWKRSFWVYSVGNPDYQIVLELDLTRIKYMEDAH